MKRRGDRITMVTAYDAPSGRLADDAGVELILVGDSAAMTVLGHDSTVPATVDEMLVLTRAVTRGAQAAARDRGPAVRLLPGLGRVGARERDPVRQGGRRRRREARGRRADALARARDRRSGDPGDGPHRADAPVGDDARRLQGAGTDGGEGAAARRGRARARGGRLLRDRARGGAGAGGGARDEPARGADDRDRRGRRDGRPGARLARPARPLRGARAAVREAVRGARRRDPPSARGVRRGGAQRRLPGGAAHVLDARGGAGGVPRRGDAGRRAVPRRPRRRARARAAGTAVAATARGQLQAWIARLPIASSTTDQPTASATRTSKTTSPSGLSPKLRKTSVP